MKTKLTLGLSVLLTVGFNSSVHAAAAAPVPLPEFMDKQQLARWTADAQTAEANAVTVDPASYQFYTGKPYVTNDGGYVYRYRTYSPEISRWTSADPSGFPNGANNQHYAPNPTRQIDALGLTISLVPDGTASPSSTTTVGSDGNTYTVSVGDIQVQDISSSDTTLLSNEFSGQGFNFTNGSSGTSAEVDVISYFANSPSSGALGLSITLSTSAGYDFTQSITNTSNDHGSSDPFADSTLSGSAIGSSLTTESYLPNITPAEAIGLGVHGDLGGGNFYDTPTNPSVSSNSVGTWTGTLYVESVSGNSYSLIGALTYSYTISE
jgi:RHS repeat-associated protein